MRGQNVRRHGARHQRQAAAEHLCRRAEVASREGGRRAHVCEKEGHRAAPRAGRGTLTCGRKEATAPGRLVPVSPTAHVKGALRVRSGPGARLAEMAGGTWRM